MGELKLSLCLSENIGSAILFKTGTWFVTLEQVCSVRLLVFTRQHARMLCCVQYVVLALMMADDVSLITGTGTAFTMRLLAKSFSLRFDGQLTHLSPYSLDSLLSSITTL